MPLLPCTPYHARSTTCIIPYTRYPPLAPILIGPAAPSTVGVSSCASQNPSLNPSPPLVASPSRFLHAAAATARRGHTQRVTPAPARLCLHGMPFPPSSPATQNPPPLSHLPKLSLSPLKPVQASCHAAYQQRNPCHPSSLPLPPLVRSVLSTLRSPALLSLVCPSHPINYTLPSCLFPDPAPRLPRCCCTSVATP